MPNNISLLSHALNIQSNLQLLTDQWEEAAGPPVIAVVSNRATTKLAAGVPESKPRLFIRGFHFQEDRAAERQLGNLRPEHIDLDRVVEEIAVVWAVWAAQTEHTAESETGISNAPHVHYPGGALVERPD